MRADTPADFGSLRVIPKRPQHVHGSGDDGTTTRAGKAAAMAGGINLTLPVRSMREHRQVRARVIALIIVVAVLGGGIAVMIGRML